MPQTDNEPIMRLVGIAKTFGSSTVALRGVDLEIYKGQVLGLLGANGAGKSTLIKILSGAFSASGGRIYWRGKPVECESPRAANDLGIATIHQHIPLVPTLTVIENVFLGQRGAWRRSKTMRKQFEDICERVGYRVPPDALVSDLPIGERQMVAIFQALSTGAEMIVMDEPTASLAAEERERVYETIKRLSKRENKAILFVSHFLDEIMALTDRVTVLRDGAAVMTNDTASLDEEKIAEAIVGKQIAAMERAGIQRSADATQEDAAKVTPRLELRQLSSPGKLAPVDLKVAPGEVIGIAGLLGSGRSELVHAIFGADAKAKGDVLLDGKPVGRSTGASVKAGIGLVPEERMGQGLIPGFEIWRNISLPALGGVSRLNALPAKSREFERGWQAIERLGIKAGSPDVLVTELSGGNAQKVTIGKWLFNDVRLFLMDEPTHGIDVGAKADILTLIRQLADAGNSVIFISSDFDELLAVCDRILVMRDGAIVAEREPHNTREHDLLLASGGKSATLEDVHH